MKTVPASKPALQARTVTILGATGSIGDSAVNVLSQHPERFMLTALTAGRNVEKLAALAKRLRPQLAVIADEALYGALKDALKDTGIRTAAGENAVAEAAAMPADVVIAGMVGFSGLKPVMEAIRRGSAVALANKECLVCAGELMMREVKSCNATLIPVDSEHNALFQISCMDNWDGIESLVITGSGGPFRTWTQKQMDKATPAEATKHPTWNMGAKISVDSATLMNKGLEMIEAFHLFPVRPEQIELVIHPESIIHGMVRYCDGSVIAQMSLPDMRTPISYALGWPDRMTLQSPRMDFTSIRQLTFEQPDEQRFPALRLAREALAAGGTAPAVLNAANEVAVDRFLRGLIRFSDIPALVEKTLNRFPITKVESIEQISELDETVRKSLNN